MSLMSKIRNTVKSQINQMQLSDVIIGVVTKDNPLMIDIDQRYILPPKEDAVLSDQLFVQALTIKGQLIEDDKVIMIKRAGSQKYYIIDWLEKAPRE